MPLSEQRIAWRRIPLPPGFLDQLNRRSDRLATAQALGYLATIGATGAAAIWAARSGAWGLLAIALALHGTVCAFLINAVHELVHGTVFRSRWPNAAFAHLFAFLGWINHRQFWASHAEHHAYTLHEPLDLENPQPIRARLRDFLLHATIDPLSFLAVVRRQAALASGRLPTAWDRHLLAGQAGHGPVIAWSRFLLAGHAGLAAAGVATGWWIVPVVVSLHPLYGRGLFWLLNSTQHVGMLPDADDFRLNCRTILVHPLLRFLYWHMNFHIEHHMYAAVPCYRLAALHRAIAQALPPCPRGLLATWYHIIGIQARAAEEPGWRFIPALPDTTARTMPPYPSWTAPPAAIPVYIGAAGSTVWQCAICGFIYDESRGLPEEGIAPGTPWEAIPASWRCPDCGIGKADFAMVAMAKSASAGSVAAAPARAIGDDKEGTVAVIGGGMAAVALVRELRRRAPHRPIVLITRDDGAIYAKPALSAACALGHSPDALATGSLAALAAELDLQVRSGTAAIAIDRDRRVVETGAGPIPFQRLVLALGAEPRRPELAGDGADQVLTVNDLAGYRLLRSRLATPGAPLAIIGGGLVGCEFANDFAAAGHPVTILDRSREPLARLLPAPCGRRLRERLAAIGAAWHGEAAPRRVERLRGGGLRITGIGHPPIEAAAVLSAIGLAPRTSLAAAAGLAVGSGIITDDLLATSDPAIAAVGDCAAIGGTVRPFILPLRLSACALAATLTGTPTPVRWPALPIRIKTPAWPVLAVPPGEAGTWSLVDDGGESQVARCHAADGRLLGLVLAGAACGRREELAALAPPEALVGG